MHCGSLHESGQGLGNTQPGSGVPFISETLRSPFCPARLRREGPTGVTAPLSERVAYSEDFLLCAMVNLFLRITGAASCRPGQESK